MERHALSCPKWQGADSAAPSKSTTTNTRCEMKPSPPQRSIAPHSTNLTIVFPGKHPAADPEIESTRDAQL